MVADNLSFQMACLFVSTSYNKNQATSTTIFLRANAVVSVTLLFIPIRSGVQEIDRIYVGGFFSNYYALLCCAVLLSGTHVRTVTY